MKRQCWAIDASFCQRIYSRKVKNNLSFDLDFFVLDHDLDGIGISLESGDLARELSLEIFVLRTIENWYQFVHLGGLVCVNLHTYYFNFSKRTSSLVHLKIEYWTSNMDGGSNIFSFYSDLNRNVSLATLFFLKPTISLYEAHHRFSTSPFKLQKHLLQSLYIFLLAPSQIYNYNNIPPRYYQIQFTQKNYQIQLVQVLNCVLRKLQIRLGLQKILNGLE